MSKTIEIRLPEGYEDATHLVVVAPGDQSASGWERYATVLRINDVPEGVATEEVEEIGGGPLTQIMTDAARAIRTGTAALETA